MLERLMTAMLATMLGCEASVESEPAEASTGPKADGAASEGEALWDQYVAFAGAQGELQPGCEPTRVSPPPGVPVKGVAILLHGFTACPQQFVEMAQPLAAAGYDVMLPTLPGHGLQPDMNGETFVDRIEGLPGTEDQWRYHAFAAQMADIADGFGGERIVGGLSLGGAMAMSSVMQRPEVWDRAIVFAPFFDMSGALRYVFDLSPGFFRMGWGGGCLDERTRPAPRAGICEFKVDQLKAVMQFGRAVKADFDLIDTPTMMVGIDDDPAASPRAIRDAANMSDTTDLCFMPKGVTHGMVSRYDSPDVEKWWMDELNRQAVRFVSSAVPFDTAGASSWAPYPLCGTAP